MTQENDASQTDTDTLEMSGVRLCFADARVTIRRAGGENVAFLEAYVKAIQPYRVAIAATKVTGLDIDETIIYATAGVYSRTVVQRIEFPRGAKRSRPLVSPRAIHKWLLHEQETFADIIAFAQDWKTFSLDPARRAEAMGEAA